MCAKSRNDYTPLKLLLQALLAVALDSAIVALSKRHASEYHWAMDRRQSLSGWQSTAQ